MKTITLIVLLIIGALAINTTTLTIPDEIIVTVEAHADMQPLQTPLPLTGQSIVAMAWSPDASQLAVGRFDGTLEIRDSDTNQLVQSLIGHTGGITEIAWSSTGDRLISGSRDLTARLWNISNGQLIATLEHPDTVWSVAWSSTSNTVFTAIDCECSLSNDLKAWDAGTGELLKTQTSSGSISRIKLNPDESKLLVVTPPFRVNILDSYTLYHLPDLSQNDGEDLSEGIWHPADNMIAVSSIDAKVRLWTIEPPQLMLSLNANESIYNYSNPRSQLVEAITFNSDGSILSSISYDGTLRSWNTSTGEVISTTQLPPRIITAAFSPDGTLLAYTNNSLENSVQIVEVLAD